MKTTVIVATISQDTRRAWQKPSVSPRRTLLVQCLEALDENREEFQKVIVCCDSSDTDNFVSDLCKKYEFEFLQVEPTVNHYRNPVTAFNEGAAVADAKNVLVFMHDDTIVTEGAVKELSALAKSGCVAIGKVQCFGVEKFDTYRQDDGKPGSHFLAVKASDFVKIGGFDKDFSDGIGFEGDAFALDAEVVDVPLVYSGEALAYHRSHPKCHNYSQSTIRSRSILAQKKIDLKKNEVEIPDEEIMISMAEETQELMDEAKAEDMASDASLGSEDFNEMYDKIEKDN